MLEIANIVFNELNNEKIDYCHFKSNEHLKAGLDGETDLDILIKLEDKDRSEQIFKKIGLKRFEPTKIGEYPGVVNWYGYDKIKGKLIHLHTHYNLITGKGLVKDYYLPWEKIMLETSILDDETNVMKTNPDLEYILLCTRMVLKRKLSENIKSNKKKIYIDKDILREVKYLKSLINVCNVEEYIMKIFSQKNAVIILQLMMKIDNLTKKEFKKLNSILKKELKKYRRMPTLVASVKSFKNKINRKMNRKMNKNFNCMFPLKKRYIERGLSIAFVGIDGSGKSTVSSVIEKWLGEEFDTKKFYAGAGDGKKNLISTILLNTYKKNRKTRINEQKSEKRNSNKSKFYKVKNLFGAISYYKILKDNIKNIKKINEYCNKGCFCVMDRFPQGQIESEHDGPKIQKYLKNKNFFIVNILANKEKKLFYKLENELPKFDLIFKMYITPELAVKRKPDHDYNDLVKKAKSLDSIDFAVKNIITINTDNELEKVILEVKNYIWNAI